jgi:hypothetical protein
MPRLMDLEGRAPVRFRSIRGEAVAAQDVATVLRRYPLVQSSFEQEASGACTLVYRALGGAAWSAADLEAELEALLGQPLALRADPELGRRGPAEKVIPFSTRMIEE